MFVSESKWKVSITMSLSRLATMESGMRDLSEHNVASSYFFSIADSRNGSVEA